MVVDTDDWEGYGGWNDLNPYPVLLKRFFAWQERWGLTRAAAVTVASRALQTLVWAMGGPPERVFYLPNGCIPRPAVSRAAKAKRRPTLLLYTRFFEYNVERLWRIVEGVWARIPDEAAVGGGEGLLRGGGDTAGIGPAAGWQVTEGASPALDADLVYAGLVPAEDLPAHFVQADVALYPFDDTLLKPPKSRSSCWICWRRAFRSSPTGGPGGGGIRHGESGWLVPPGDDAAFIEP